MSAPSTIGDAPAAATGDRERASTRDARGPSFLAAVAEGYRALLRYRAFVHFCVTCRIRATLGQTLLRDLWQIIEPLAHMAIYYFLVVIVFGARGDGSIHPVVFLLLGITHYFFLHQAMVASCQALLANQNLMMQLRVEPLVFTAVSFYKTLREFAISLALYAIVFLWLGPGLSWRALAYPALLIELLLLAWCGAVLLSTLVIFFRDLEQIARIVLRAAMYMAPVVYLITFVPERYRAVYLANPIACLFNLFQWSLLDGPAPPAAAVIGMLALTVAFAAAAHYAYYRARPYFTKAF